MSTITSELPASHGPLTTRRALHLPLGLTWTAIGLGLVVIVAAVLRLYNIQAVGDSNPYYTAAVKSMLQSFHNFFFAAAEPGGSVTVDKPPLGLWLQAISAFFLGVNGVAVVLPQIVAGILSVPLLFVLIRRYFGSIAGLVAALALAITPVSIAVERNNTMDATLIFTLLLAAWAFIKATDTRRLRYLLLGGLLVGLGFNIKMMQAFLSLPAFYALYFLGAKVGIRRKIAHLALATVVLVVVSFSWATVVQLTPADQRPYIGSTQTNNVFDLIFGYNGVDRLLGGAGTPGVPGAQPDGNQGQLPAGMNPPTGAPGNFAPPQDGTRLDGQGRGPQDGGNGVFNTGQTGVFRLLTAPLGNEVGWLLPFGLLSIGLLLVGQRLTFPLDDNQKAAVLWGGWLLTATVFFSIASFFHPYYLAMLSVPLAAMVGIGAAKLWDSFHARSLPIRLLIVALVAAVLGFQVFLAKQYTTNLMWIVPAGIALIAGAAVAILRRKAPQAVALAFACLLIAMLWLPAGWGAMTTLYTNPSAMLPEAYSGNTASTPGGPMQFSAAPGTAAPGAPGQPDAAANSALVSYLQAHTQGIEYLVAVPSANQGDSLVLATGRPVLYMGGFTGSDPVVDGTKLAQLVADGKLRYVLGGGGGMPGNGNSSVTSWLQANCTVVSDYASGSTNTTTASDGFGRAAMNSTLYQCGVSA